MLKMNNHLFNGAIMVLLAFLTYSLSLNSLSSPKSVSNSANITANANKSDSKLETTVKTDKRDIMAKKIKEMYVRYNLYRNKSSEIYKSDGWNSARMQENNVQIEKADKANYLEAKDLFTKYGLPSNSKVGEELAHQYWLIVVQCNNDPDFQRSVLKQMYTAMEESDISTSDYASLADRVRINKGKQQIYGTQIKYNELKKTYEPYDLKDPVSVDQRRIMMGLEPMKKYIRQMNLKYEGSPKRNSTPKRLNRKI